MMRSRTALTVLASFLGLLEVVCPPVRSHAAEPVRTVLGIEGAQFTMNAKRTFLLGFSYYGALGGPEDFIRKDLDDFQRLGFNWLRVWATWSTSGQDVSAVDAEGEAREPFLSRLKWLVVECDRRGMAVDVTLTRGKQTEAGGRVTSFAAHARAVKTLVKALMPHRNWYLDLANERDVRDDRYVSAAELKKLRETVRKLDPARLVTASFGGHDLSFEEVREALMAVGVDLLCPHRPRHEKSPAETESHTRACLEFMAKLGRTVPVHYQEPFRRGYAGWEPGGKDFVTDLRGAKAGGAAGWCFHNGSQRVAGGTELGRSFDMRKNRLFDQLDTEELRFVEAAGAAVGHPPE